MLTAETSVSFAFCWSSLYYENFSEAEGIVGEHLGTVTGMIDEWTPEEGYVDFAGSICGDFYSVKGYDPEFMLCISDSLLTRTANPRCRQSP